MSDKKFVDLYIVCPPFVQLYLPSYDTAALVSCIKMTPITFEQDFMYLNYAVEIGGEIYQTLMETSLGDAVFSVLLFPENYQRVKNEFDQLCIDEALDFDKLLQMTHKFVDTYLDTVEDFINSESRVLFHLYSKQFIPALYIAKRVYSKFACKIWLSGYHCQSIYGESLLNIFSFVDKIFGQDIETKIIDELLNFGGKRKRFYADDIPYPSYDKFISDLALIPDDFRKKYIYHSWYQIEFNRGCPWNKCVFCTLNYQYPNYEERSISRIVSDYKSMQKKYKTTKLLVTSRNCNFDWKQLVKELNSEFPGMRGTYDLSFKVSDLLKEEDICFLSKNDICSLIGVESFSRKCLSIMDKGQTVIESIQMLKYMERYNNKCFYNLMCGLPFETNEDIEETESVISYICHMPPPFSVEVFRLTCNSKIYKEPEKHFIKSMGIRKNFEYIFFPESLHGRYVPFFMDFESVFPDAEKKISRFNVLVEKWADKYYSYARRKIPRPKQHSLFYMRKNDYVIELYDSRFTEKYSIYTICDLEREIYEFCDEIRSFEKICEKFSEQSQKCLLNILNGFVENKFMFKEDANYLSLAI